MADDKTVRGPQDASQIAPGEDCEARYWTDTFGASAEALGTVLSKVGTSADAVERQIENG